MAKDAASSRRQFLQGGAILAAPLVASVAAAAIAHRNSDPSVARLEAEAAIRGLHDTWLRQVNSGASTSTARLDRSVRRITSHYAGAPDRIEIAADGQTAVGYFDHSVEFEAPLASDSTLAQMALVQGTAAVSHTERRILAIDYSKSHDGWRIASVALR